MNDTAQILEKANEFLEKTTSETPVATADLVKYIIDALHLDTKHASKVYPTLRDAAKEPDPPFSSRRGRNGGYFKKTASSVQSGQDDQSAKVSSLNIETTKEKHLWPLVASWLKTEKDYQYASDTHANVKSNGKWGNPDVVGLNLIEEFGFFNIEIVTVEVKPSLSSWRTWIFEAVSHKRFSERVYFAVRTNDPDGSEISELARYSEKYGIGLLIIDLLDSDYRKLTNWTSISDDQKSSLLEKIEERVHAPFEDVSIKEKVNFIKSLGFKDKNHLIKTVQ